jgi:hypothetical protein
MTHRAWGGQDCKERSKIVWSLPGFAPSARICNIEGQCWKRSVPGCRDSTTSKQQAREQQQSRRVMSSITTACEAGVLKTPSSGAIEKPTRGDTIGLSGVFAIARHPGVKRAIGLSGDLPRGRAAIRSALLGGGGVDFRVVSATLSGWTFKGAIREDWTFRQKLTWFIRVTR